MMFSVVTPSFNCGPFILENFRSVQSQGCGAEQLEHWVIDGGSTDGTVELLKKQPGIQWVSEKDHGLSDAVNKGIQRAQGDWIIWLNADDFLAPDAIRTFKEYLARHPSGRVFAGDCNYIRADGSVEQRVAGWDYNLNDLLGCETGINQPSTFVHREVYAKVGLLDVDSRYIMDYEWVVRAMHAYQCIPIPHVLACSRRRQGSITNVHLLEQFKGFLEQRRKYNRPYLSRAEFKIRFFIWTDFLRQNRWLRARVRAVKRLFGREPLHPI
jgi:glycosyltransferase involved in cell wall biosynthesis